MAFFKKHLLTLINSEKQSLFFILGVGLIARLVMNLGTAGILWPDSLAYISSAANIARDLNFYPHEIYRTPGYSTFLAIFFSIFGRTTLAGHVIIFTQRLLGLLATYFCYRIAKRCFGPATAFFASLIFTISTTELYYETVVQTEVLFMPAFLGSVLYFLSINEKLIGDRSRNISFFYLGLLGAVVTLIRPIARPLTFLLIGFTCLKNRKRSGIIFCSILALASFSAFLLPWMAINKVTFGIFQVSQDVGINMFHKAYDVARLDPIEDASYPKQAGVLAQYRHKYSTTYFYAYDNILRRGFSHREADNRMSKFTLEAIKAHKVQYGLNVATTFFALLFNNRDSGLFCERGVETFRYLCSSQANQSLDDRSFRNYKNKYHRQTMRGIDWYYHIVSMFSGALGIFFTLGVIIYFCSKPPDYWQGLMLLLLILYFAGLTAILNREEDRFRLPVDPFMMMFAVAGVVKGLSNRWEKTQII